MGRAKIDRTGEENYNSFGSKMVIKEYKDRKDMDVYFPEYNWTINHADYGNFKKGNIRCPYERRVHGKGYISVGKYKIKENGELTRQYKIWSHMLQRCYDPKYLEKYPTYKDCEVCTEWHNFQTFAEWYNDNYYEIEDGVMCLDKDILIKGNKIYSPETCIFVPNEINLLFVKRDNDRGKDPIGAHQLPSGNYLVRCNNGYGKRINLGTYTTKEEAFRVYKQYKEKVIKEVIDSYKGKIPEPYYSRLRDAMYNYQVEIDD